MGLDRDPSCSKVSRWAIAFAVLWMLATSAEAGWKAGTSRVAITPKEPMWMAGYAARTKPSEGAIHDLWAKALALEDPTGQRAILVTLDICGIDRELSNRVRDALKSRHRLDRDRIVLACSHTGCPGRAREPTSRNPGGVRRRLPR